VRLGFGIDGNADADFINVRGTYEENSFVKKIQGEIEEVERRYRAVMDIFF